MTAPMPAKLQDLLNQAANEAEDPTARLFAAATVRAEVDEWMKELASAAREAGHTWADIGLALGVTRQAAEKRWGRSAAAAWVFSAADSTLRPATDGDLATVRTERARFEGR